MYKIIARVYYCTIILFASCASNSNETKKPKVDTIRYSQVHVVSSGDLSDNPTQEFRELVDQYKSYVQTGEQIDTTIVLGIDSFHIVLNHYSTNDSGIVVPAEYLGFYGMNRFVTSAFQSKLSILKNGSLFSDRRIVRKDFDLIADNSMKDFGVLLYPNLDICKGHIEVHYSLSIPLSDVGKRVKVQVQDDGSLKFLDGDSCE